MEKPKNLYAQAIDINKLRWGLLEGRGYREEGYKGGKIEVIVIV